MKTTSTLFMIFELEKLKKLCEINKFYAPSPYCMENIARELKISPSTLHNWIYEKTHPTFRSVHKLKEYIKKNREGIEKDLDYFMNDTLKPIYLFLKIEDNNIKNFLNKISISKIVRFIKNFSNLGSCNIYYVRIFGVFLIKYFKKFLLRKPLYFITTKNQKQSAKEAVIQRDYQLKRSKLTC